MRTSRRMGLYGNYPTLAEFWSAAVVETCLGGSSSSKALRNGLLIGDTYTPVYVIASKGDSMILEKYKDGILAVPHVTNYLVWYPGDEDIGYITTYPDNESSSNTTIYLTTLNGVWENPDKLYGYVVVALRFPSFSEEVIDRMFERMMGYEPLANAYHYGSGTSAVYIADEDLSSNPDDVYIQCGCSASSGYFSVTQGGSPETALVSSGSIAFWRHYNSRYYFSTSGSSNTSTRAGGIYKITPTR